MASASNTSESGALSDEQILEKAFNADNGNKFKLRYTSQYEDSELSRYYETRRQAEVALLTNLAFWTACNRQQMWRLFRESELFRSELEEYPQYRQDIIREAVELVSDTYTPTGLRED